MSEVRSYYNTNNLTGSDLKEAIIKAEKQEEAIELLYANSDRSYSPSQVLGLMNKAGKQWPITSLRRAITNLQKKGVLVKTGEMVKGMYSSPENTWKYKRQAVLTQSVLL